MKEEGRGTRWREEEKERPEGGEEGEKHIVRLQLRITFKTFSPTIDVLVTPDLEGAFTRQSDEVSKPCACSALSSSPKD